MPSCLSLSSIPPEDPAVYDMICNADTIGVFQIESRAQMSMLPRLRPRCFYDLVIEVAIVRPGPIQGDMVHPYLRRRNGQEPITYPNEKIRRVLGKTLGVPLFQEQAMSLAIEAAGFTPGEADQLRRAMAAWKRRGNLIETFKGKFLKGMRRNGYDDDFAERCFRQIEGFSEYGFPESHSASFALLVYVSSWIKKYYPAAFAAALINSQPMGFYAPAQIVRDAQNHGVEVRPVDVNFSGWDCRLEERHEGTEARRHGGGNRSSSSRDAGDASPPLGPSNRSRMASPSCLRAFVPPCLRLGFRLIKGLREEEAHAIADAVARHGPFDSIAALRRASGVRVATLHRLAAADAFGSMGLDRQQALWRVRSLRDEQLPMFDEFEEVAPPPERDRPRVPLPEVPPLKQVVHDYDAMHLSLKAHPLSFVRDQLTSQKVTPAKDLMVEKLFPNGRSIKVAGLVLVRQRPGTAQGIIFMTIEDETGVANLIVRPQIFQKYRSIARHGTAIVVRGTVERQGQVVHVQVTSFESLDDSLAALASRSRNFH